MLLFWFEVMDEADKDLPVGMKSRNTHKVPLRCHHIGTFTCWEG